MRRTQGHHRKTSWLTRQLTKLRGIPQHNVAEAQQALHLRMVGQLQADTDATQGDAVAKLITSLADTPHALVQIGSVLLLKTNGVLTVRNLTPLELTHLRRNPQLSGDPATCLHELQTIADHHAQRVRQLRPAPPIRRSGPGNRQAANGP